MKKTLAGIVLVVVVTSLVILFSRYTETFLTAMFTLALLRITDWIEKGRGIRVAAIFLLSIAILASGLYFYCLPLELRYTFKGLTLEVGGALLALLTLLALYVAGLWAWYRSGIGGNK